MRVYYSPAYVGSGFAFDTTRKAGWLAASLADDPIGGVELVAPAPLTREDVAAVHDPGYVDAVITGRPRSLAESQGFDWDPGLWPAVAASNGGAVAAALASLQDGVAGSLSSGLHHAHRGSGAGFCTFNGLVLAAHAALAAGVGSVLVLDLDAHCGDGTAELIGDEPRVRQLDVSVCGYGDFPETDRVKRTIVRDAAEYLPAVGRALAAADRDGPPGLLLYNAGMDPYEHCATGGLAGVTAEVLAERERLVFGWCRERGVPVAFVLAGGYTGRRLTEAGLVALHRLTLAAAAGVCL